MLIRESVTLKGESAAQRVGPINSNWILFMRCHRRIIEFRLNCSDIGNVISGIMLTLKNPILFSMCWMRITGAGSVGKNIPLMLEAF